MRLVIPLLAIAVLATGRAEAQGTLPPDASNSTFSQNPFPLVGRNSANTPAEDVRGEIEATIRDNLNSPIPGVPVTLDFSACLPDIRLSSVQTYPGLSIDCGTKIVTAITDQLGRVKFRILGGASNDLGNAPGVLTNCATLRGNGVFFINLAVAAMDQVGSLDGVKPSDLSVVITDINQGNTARRDDLNLDGVVNPGDIGAMVTYVNQGRSAENTGTICP